MPITLMMKHISILELLLTFIVCYSSIASSDFVPFPTFLFVLGIIVPSCPAGIQLHVYLSFLLGQGIVLGLFLLGQCMPLKRQK